MFTFTKIGSTCILGCLMIGIGINQSLAQQTPDKQVQGSETGERVLVVETVKNFYIGDKTGSIEHKKLSMHVNGAYRYINKQGDYVESKFKLDSDHADPSYEEELLRIEVYENVALARVRLEKIKKKEDSKIEYKLMTLHKTQNGWRVTSISWGFGITH